MKKVLSAQAAVILAALSLCSCSSKVDEDEETSQTLTGYVNYVTDLSTGETMAYTGVSYTVNYNYSTMKSTVVANSLKLTDGTSYPGLTLSDVKWSIDNNKWKTISLSGVQPTAINYYMVPTFTDFTFKLQDEVVGDDGYIAHTYISMLINGNYQVYSLPKSSVLTATTIAETPTSLVSTYSTTESIYVAEIDPETGLLDLTINSFAVNDGTSIPAVAIKNIPYTIDKTTVSFAKDSATSSIIGSVEDPENYKWAVSDLKGQYGPDGFTLSYTITIEGTVTTVTAQATY